MKKTFYTILLLTFTSNISLFGQNQPLELTIKKAVFEAGTTTLTIDLEYINKSTDTLYLVQPQNIFFDKHYRDVIIDYPQLNSYPYTLKLESNNVCTDGEVIRFLSNLAGKKAIDSSELLILLPGGAKTISNIQIDYEGNLFCNDVTYNVKIFYNQMLLSSTEPSVEKDKKIEDLLNKQVYYLETNLFECSSKSIKAKKRKPKKRFNDSAF